MLWSDMSHKTPNSLRGGMAKPMALVSGHPGSNCSSAEIVESELVMLAIEKHESKTDGTTRNF